MEVLNGKDGRRTVLGKLFCRTGVNKALVAISSRTPYVITNPVRPSPLWVSMCTRLL
jgi:hypothetical protein